jgi:hypothetical protein
MYLLSFHSIKNLTFCHHAGLKMASDDFKDFESVEYKGEIDWDAEWKKVVEDKAQPNDRGRISTRVKQKFPPSRWPTKHKNNSLRQPPRFPLCLLAIP